MLNETFQLAKTHREISQIDITEYNEFHKRICTEHQDGEKYFGSFQKLVQDYNQDKTKFNDELKQIKSLLLDALNNLETLSAEKLPAFTESKFGSRLGEPNDNFLRLLIKIF